MDSGQTSFQNEERSPLLWGNDSPDLFLGTAGHIAHPGKGRLFPPCLAYYLGVVWGVQGEICINIAGRPFILGPDKVCFIQSGSRYCLEALADIVEFVYISFDGKASQTLLSGHDLWEGVFRSGPAPVHQVRSIMDRLPRTQNSDVRVNLVQGLDLLKEIGLYHSRTTRDKAVLRAKILIHQCWKQQQFNVNSVSDLVGANRSPLSVRFRQSTGQTMLEYLHTLRLGATLRMLGETDLPVSRIAHECGFSDPSYFARFFKKKTGVSPHAFRENPEEIKPPLFQE